MRYLINLVRSLLFAPVFYTGSLLVVLAALIGFPFSQRFLSACAHGWGHFHYACARIFLGIRVNIIGEFSEKPVLYAIKHESMFETIEVLRLFKNPGVVAKQELSRIPFWGAVARRYGMIFVDRGGGASSLRQMLRTVRGFVAKGRSIVIFAEGTRVPHGERPPLQSGFAGLYKIANLPVVPIAVNTGLHSPKHSFVKKPGVVTYLIGEEIPPGLPRAEIEARVHEAINALNGEPV
ncbi:lysophospholipid acyltransferase family protein [Sphingorhabdus sp. Alg239-R122]|uniref:lysophospholipid acyltransferase family protein n=1 Tax=Sphingorhabdus sp. Alg239-R122 TaxID=2305989 RepID=UPI0031F6F040